MSILDDSRGENDEACQDSYKADNGIDHIPPFTGFGQKVMFVGLHTQRQRLCQDESHPTAFYAILRGISDCHVMLYRDLTHTYFSTTSKVKRMTAKLCPIN